MICCTQANLAFLGGGTPYCQRLSFAIARPPIGDVGARIGEDIVRTQVGEAVVVEGIALCDLPVNSFIFLLSSKISCVRGRIFPLGKEFLTQGEKIFDVGKEFFV